MKSNAASQLFGYSLQFPRALLRLLQAKPGSKIGVEVCGDVAVFFPEGIKLTEENKSSINNNPLTDASENLWKTFYNWISAIKNNELNSNNDRFVLYTNHAVSDNSIVIRLATAETSAKIDAAVEFAKNN